MSVNITNSFLSVLGSSESSSYRWINTTDSFGSVLGCPADLNQSGVVNVIDVLTWLAVFGETCNDGEYGCLGDVNNDGVVDISDL